ncbi:MULTISPECIES: TetR/AcrR family transcriptional regulator [Enterococcus]|uniref:HTH tetR-type domain-containing protein n=1 Tax=Enterococcus diestrammenae TaxID=1155073 RepID=A0ABV0F4N1_9ENTE|nr:TetR/AcrR family transcriptional regulator [Enterococcus diestrammenae]KAF1295482.1 TetR family transcriptional regulator [Enterococcus diestrammenae]HIX70910.1 TetR/AcrR family transcriptional regulator [Candidatus Enterococcus stercoravium]
MAKAYTKELIRQTIIDLLNETPLSQITVKEIAATCQINRNTFYYYYSDVYELLAEIFQTEIEQVIEEYNDTLSWEESFYVATKFALDNKKAIYHIYNSMRQEEVINYVYNVAGNVMTRYVKRVSANIPAKELDQLLIARFYQAALTEMLLRWIATGMKEDPQKVISRIGLLFDGNIELSLKRSTELD